MNTRHLTFVRRSLSVVAAALVGSALLAAPALAVADDAVRVAVQFEDLDLAKPTGAGALYQRIAAAAGKACGDAQRRDLRPYVSIRKCRREAIDRAVASVPSAEFAAWHAAQQGKPSPARVAAAR